MDKEARLSSARKKLKKFRRNRETKTHPNNTGADEQMKERRSNGGRITESSAHSDVRDSPVPHAHSTAGSAESILQVSSTLNGIIAEVESLTENGTYFAGSEKTASEYSSSENISTLLDDTIKDLQKRNIELMEKVGVVEVEREQLKAQCRQYSDQINTLTMKTSDAEVTHSQLDAQKQTIEILVSEKQNLQRHLSDLKTKAQSGDAEHMVLQETLQACKKQIDAYEIELSQKSQLISSMESTIGPLRNECENYREESAKVAQAFEREKLQTAELSMKLNMRETEFNQLLESHSYMQEKLSMAEVLLQQYSSRKDEMSDTAKLEAENRHLSSDLQNSHAALEKLADERDHIIKQHADSQKDWEHHIDQLQSEIQILQQALENAKKLSEPVENPVQTVLPQDVLPAEVTIVTADSACQTDNLFEETITALSNNNLQLSQLLHEKELQIQRLENELQEAKNVIEGHENLLDSSRNDKVTISRALTQNKQLKEQLEEIQDTFITISNDKMDLATQLSTLESVNKNLSERLREITDGFNMAKHDLDHQKARVIALEEDMASTPVPLMTPDEPQINMLHMPEPEINVNGTEREVADSESDVLKDGGEPAGGIQITTSEVSNGLSPPDGDEPAVGNGRIPNTMSDVSVDSLPSEHYQTNPKMMDMLQQKFTSVMQERADLMNRVEMLEHANTQLQNECDTIGEYITLYHNQRQLLKQRHHEKDVYISSIIQEREEMRGKVEQLQTLVGTVLKSTAHAQPSKLLDSEHGISREPSNSDSDISLPKPNLDPETAASMGEPVPSTVEQVTVHPFNHIQNATDDLAAQQILKLLQQMQRPAEPPSPTSSRPSGFCMHYIGPYTAI